MKDARTMKILFIVYEIINKYINNCHVQKVISNLILYFTSAMLNLGVLIFWYANIVVASIV